MSQKKPTFLAANLTPEQTYRVIAPFTDFDGDLHPVGETWRFVKKSFLPYEDGLTLFIVQNEQQKTIRLQWLPETQAQIIDHFSDYVEALPGIPVDVPPTEGNLKRKRPLWARILIGFMVAGAMLSCSIVALFVVMEIWMAYRPPAPVDMEVPTIGVDLKSPSSVKLAQDFVLEVQIENSAGYAQTLDSIQIDTGYLSGVKVNRTDPPYGKTSTVKMSHEYLSYSFQTEIPAQSTLAVKFYLTAVKIGQYSGQLAVCIHSAKSCPLHFTPLFIK